MKSRNRNQLVENQLPAQRPIASLRASKALLVLSLSFAIAAPQIGYASSGLEPAPNSSALRIFQSMGFVVREEVYPGDDPKISECESLKTRLRKSGRSMKTLALQGTSEFQARRHAVLKQCPAIDIEKPIRVRMPYASTALGTNDYEKLAANFGRQLESELPIEILESPWKSASGERMLIKMLSPVDVTFDEPDTMKATFFGMVDTKTCFLHSLPVAYTGYPSIAENNWAEIVELDGRAGVLAVSYSEPLRTFRATFSGVDPDGRIEAPMCSFDYEARPDGDKQNTK